MIEIVCPADKTLHYAEEANAGKTIRCRKCGAILDIVAKPQPFDLAGQRKEKKRAATAEGKDQGKAPDDVWQRLLSPEVLIGATAGVLLVILTAALWPDRPVRVPANGAVKLAPTAIDINATPPPAPPSVPEPAPAPEPVPAAAATPPPAKHPLAGKRITPASASPANPATPLPPCATGHQPARPVNGQRIEPDGGTSGTSSIRLVNSADRDAVVKLVDTNSGKIARFVYVQAGHSYGLEGLEPGAYLLRYQLGNDWVPDCRQFTRNSEFNELDQPFVVLEDRIRFFTVTLSPSTGARSGSRKIDARRFTTG